MTTPPVPADVPPAGGDRRDDGTRALPPALVRLVAAGTLTPAQARSVADELARDSRLGATPRAGRPAESGGVPWTSLLAEVGGYIGAIFVAAAIVVLVGPSWDSLPLGGKLSLLIGPAVVLLVAAVAVAVGSPGRWTAFGVPGLGQRRRVVSVLVLVASNLAAGATALVSDTGDSLVLEWSVALAITGVGFAACRSVLLHLGTATALAAFLATLAGEITDAYDLGRADLGSDSLVTGLVLAGTAVVWAGLAARRVFGDPGLGYLVAGVMAFVGSQIIVIGSSGFRDTGGDEQLWLGYGLLAALAVIGLAGYVVVRELLALVVGAVTLAVVVPQSIIDVTDGSLGAGGALLLSGLSIVTASVLGLRLHRSTAEAA